MTAKPVGVKKVPVIDLAATGQNITRLRKAAGVTVRDLQTVMGFTNPQAIYKWQNGCCLPSIDNLVILAAVLGTTVDDILVYEDEPSDDIANQFELMRSWQRPAIYHQYTEIRILCHNETGRHLPTCLLLEFYSNTIKMIH